MTKRANEPAFPVADWHDGPGDTPGEWALTGGLTKRELFTLGAMIGLLIDPREFPGSKEAFHREAVSIADRQLAALDTEPEGE